MRALLVSRLEIALTVIAALRAARRTVTVGFGLVARPRLFAAGALHQHAAALAVGDQGALARWLERLLAVRGNFVGRIMRFTRHRPIEIGTGERGNLLAELFAQHAGLDLLDLAFCEFAQLKRTVGYPDQPVHLETELRQHVAYLAVLAFADRKHQPDIGALVTLQRGVDRAIFDAVDLDTLLQFVELPLRHLAMSADAITAQPASI